ncbi:actin depolymerizing protein, partial [Glonium stellatum]
MQSGISASAELHAAFQTLLNTPTQRGLLATISNEAIVPTATIPSTTPSFLTDLKNLEPHLTPTTALYIILRRSDNPPSTTSTTTTTTPDLVAITYIPPTAPVRQKTLLASTRLTLTRALGRDHFADTLFATEAAELTAEGWRRHEAHGAAA